MQYSWGGNISIQLIKEVADNVIGHDGVQINAAKAAQLGISDGDTVEVYSPTGSVSGKAILRQGIRPDVILIIGQFGHWKTPYAKDFNLPSANSLVPMHIDFLDGSGGAIDGTKVNVRVARNLRK
jgi:phenylacetyl-CoA:acceptor oxidoreductase